MFPEINQFKIMLTEACNDVKCKLISTFRDGSIYAFVITPNGGYESFSVSISTVDDIENMYTRHGMIAAEWKHLAVYCFASDGI